MEAAAIGLGSKSENNSSIRESSSASIISFALSVGKAGILSWSVCKLLAISAGIKSGLVERSWPNLMKIVPASSRALLNLSPLGSSVE